jgi:circadian clock protein KaiC
MEEMKRFPTRVPGLDQLLHGGLFQGGVYILEGPPGVGKTTLANQIAFRHAGEGGRVLYITMLAESHARMLQHMQGQSFCRLDAVSSSIFYLSGYRELEQQGLKAVVELLRNELTRHSADFLVVDGLVVENPAETGDSIRQFVHELQSLASLMGCTCLLLTSGTGRALNAEQTMVDGIFAFEDFTYHWRSERRIHVRKFRGSAVERGKHTFCITDDGLEFFPRLEGLDLPAEDDAAPGTTSSGIASFDAILPNGGLSVGSSTMLMGDSGSGKTVLGLAFSAAASAEQKGLLLAFSENSLELQRSGREFALDIAGRMEGGMLKIHSRRQDDQGLDQLGHMLLRLVDESGAKRVVVDGLSEFADTAAFQERGYRFIGALLRHLKARGVTSIFTVEPASLQAAAGTPLAQGLAALFDNVLQLSDHEGRHLRICKMRGSPDTKTAFKVNGTTRGITVT